MYKKILIPLENSAVDDVILQHISGLAKLCKSTLLLVHVADGFVARNQEMLNLAESEEMQVDRNYLEAKTAALKQAGFQVTHRLLCGEPAVELLKIAEEEQCDLIAMATHGHRLLGDIILGSVAEQVRHRTTLPVLMVRAP